MPKDDWRGFPQGSEVVLKYSDSSQIFSDWRDGSVGRRVCCTLNDLADSTEQIRTWLDAPELT